MSALYFKGSDFNLLYQLLFVGVNSIKAIDHVMLDSMGCGIAQRAERIHRPECFLAAPLQAAVNALRLVHNQDRARCADQVNRLFPARFLCVLVKVVDVLFVDGTNRHDHDLDIRASREVAHLAELGRVIKEILEGVFA